MINFSKADAIRFGWETTKNKIGFFILILITAGFIIGASEIIANFAPQKEVYIQTATILFGQILTAFKSSFSSGINVLFKSITQLLPFLAFGAFFTIVPFVLFSIVQLGLIKICLNLIDDEEPRFKDLFSCFHLLLKYFAGSIFFFLSIATPICLFIITFIFSKQYIPQLFNIIIGIVAIIFAAILKIRLQFYTYFITDADLGPINALKKSFTITKGSTYNLFLFEFLSNFINGVGIFAFAVGLFITIPITMLAKAFIYRNLIISLGGIQSKSLSEPEEVKPGSNNLESLADGTEDNKHQIDQKDPSSIKVGMFKTLASKFSFQKKANKGANIEKATTAQPAKKKDSFFKKIAVKYNLPPQFVKNIINKLPLEKFRKKENKKSSENKPKPPSRITIFLKKYNLSPLLITSGIFIVASIVVYFLFVNPLKSTITKTNDTIISNVSQLEKYYRKGRKLNSDKLIKAKENEITIANDEIEACNTIFSEKDQTIEKIFTDLNGDAIKDEALWKNVYIDKTNELVLKLKNNGFNVNIQDLSFEKFDRILPSWKTINVVQKKFWLQNEIINTIIKEKSNIYKFNRLTFSNKTMSNNPLLPSVYTPIPFSLDIDIEHSQMFDFVRMLLNSDIFFFIETIDIKFSKDLDNYSEEQSGIINNVTMNAFAMDFVNKNKE